MRQRARFWARALVAGWNQMVTIKDHLELGVFIVAGLLALAGLGFLLDRVNQQPWIVPSVVAGIFVMILAEGAFVQWNEATTSAEGTSGAKSVTLDEQLRQFISEGQELKRRCTITSEPPPDALAENWFTRVHTFLGQNFDKWRADSWSAWRGKPTKGFTGMITPEGARLWNAIAVRVEQLEELERSVRM